MSDPRSPRIETLVAIDWDDADRRIDSILDFIRREGGPDAYVGAVPFDHVKPNGGTVGAWRIQFNARKVRNTEVHGKAYRAGFVSHIE